MKFVVEFVCSDFTIIDIDEDKLDLRDGITAEQAATEVIEGELTDYVDVQVSILEDLK